MLNNIANSLCLFKPIKSIKEAAAYCAPKVIKDNLSVALSIFGDPMMSVPLVAYTFNTTVDSFLCNDENSEGINDCKDAFYWYIFGAVVLLLYPGQILIAHKKNKIIADDLLERAPQETTNEKYLAAKNMARIVAVSTVSISGGSASYLLANSFKYSNTGLATSYGVFVMAINALFRQLFFNNGGEEYIEPKYPDGSAKKVALTSFCKGLSILFSVTAATPFAAAYMFESDSNAELAMLTLMLFDMTAGEYIRMTPSLKNYLGLLEDNQIKLSNLEEFICISSAVLRTGLTMTSISKYPTPAKVVIWGLLTPGVGLFQMAACRPPKEFARKAEEKEIINELALTHGWGEGKEVTDEDAYGEFRIFLK